MSKGRATTDLIKPPHPPPHTMNGCRGGWGLVVFGRNVSVYMNSCFWSKGGVRGREGKYRGENLLPSPKIRSGVEVGEGGILDRRNEKVYDRDT